MGQVLGKEERVVEAAPAWLEAERRSNAGQIYEAGDNLRKRLEELKIHDAGREKPRWTKPVVQTLGIEDSGGMV